MPSPEHGTPPLEPEEPTSHEREPQPYYRASRFGDERVAAGAYRAAERAIHRVPCDLSAYRLLIDRVSHVAVVGDLPPPDLDQELAGVLAAGDATELPPSVLDALLARRRQASQLGPWVERHYRPGWPL